MAPIAYKQLTQSDRYPPLPQPNLSPFRLQTGPRMRTVAKGALLVGGSQEVGGWGGLAGHLFPPLITNI